MQERTAPPGSGLPTRVGPSGRAPHSTVPVPTRHRKVQRPPSSALAAKMSSMPSVTNQMRPGSTSAKTLSDRGVRTEAIADRSSDSGSKLIGKKDVVTASLLPDQVGV